MKRRASRAASRSGKRRGFSLLEILVAVAIVAIMLAVLIPTFGNFRMKGQLRASARNLAALIRYGRTAAIYRHQLMHLRIDLENHRYRLDLMTESVRASERDDNEVEMVEEIHELDTKVMFDRVILYDGQRGSRETSVILDLTPRGNITPATIVLAETKTGERMTVDIFGTTGVVEIYEGEPAEHEDAEE